MFIQPRAFTVLLNKVINKVVDLIFSTWQNLINNNVSCFVLTYSYRILNFNFHVHFLLLLSKRALQGVFEKKGISTKNFGGGLARLLPRSHPTPLLRRTCRGNIFLNNTTCWLVVNKEQSLVVLKKKSTYLFFRGLGFTQIKSYWVNSYTFWSCLEAGVLASQCW